MRLGADGPLLANLGTLRLAKVPQVEYLFVWRLGQLRYTSGTIDANSTYLPSCDAVRVVAALDMERPVVEGPLERPKAFVIDDEADHVRHLLIQLPHVGCGRWSATMCSPRVPLSNNNYSPSLCMLAASSTVYPCLSRLFIIASHLGGSCQPTFARSSRPFRFSSPLRWPAISRRGIDCRSGYPGTP